MNAITTTEQQAAAGALAPVAGPLAGAIQALQSGVTIDHLRGLMDLQKEWEALEAKKAYVADMAAFKLNPPEILKTRQVSFSGTEYKHATLGDVTRAVVDALARHGFSHNWETKQSGGTIAVTCRITHRMGHSESVTMESAADNSGKKNPIQAVASAITYLQRYTLLGATGLATHDMLDDDGHGGSDAPPIGYSSVDAVARWKLQIAGVDNIEALRVARSAAAEEFKAAGDVLGWNEVKVYAANRKASLEGGAQ